MKGVATAAWSLNRLVTSLARAGWGDELDGACNAGLQRVLHALADLLPWEAGEGRLTRSQVADAASMSARWAGHCLRRLEALGVVTWHRGWLDKGRPRAGWMRVEKARLAELVRAARGHLDPRREQRREDTRTRLSKLRRTSLPPWRRAKPVVAPMGTECPPSHRRSTGAPRPGLPANVPTLPIGADMPACAVCGRSQHACELANRKEPFRIQHRFEPSTVGQRPTVLAQPHELHPPAPSKQQPRRGWRERVAELNRPAHPTLDIGVDQ